MTAALDRQWRKLRLAVLARDGAVCHWCGAPATEADHLVERALGGLNVMSNLVAACSSCNARRGGELGARRRAARARDRDRHPFFMGEAR